MAISANNVEQTPSFRGKWDRTDKGTPYYKTNVGLKAGAVMAVPAALFWATQKSAEKQMDMLKNLNVPDELLTNIKVGAERVYKYKYLFAAIAAVSSVGCGILIDYLRNKKAQETADAVKANGAKAVLMSDESVELSRKRRAYYKSGEGFKLGGALGAVCGLMHGAMASKTFSIGSAIILGLGGLAMGSIVDHYTNKDAHKHA